MEFYENVKVKTLMDAEDLYYISNAYCPLCGEHFKIGDEVIEATADPIVVYTGDKEYDRLVITIHLKCLFDALKEYLEDGE